MVIGIDASRAAKKQRTGVEEYTYQMILALSGLDNTNEYLLYTNKPLPSDLVAKLPNNFKEVRLPFFRLWTQVRLALEMLINPPDILWVPASAMPLFHPANTIVTIHGLEYEHYPLAYSGFARWYLRFSTKFAVKKAAKIVAVSKNTKKDLEKIYKAEEDRVTVIPNGVPAFRLKNSNKDFLGNYNLSSSQYFIYYGRLEERKNLVRLIKAWSLFRKENPEKKLKLVLAGSRGYGYKKIIEACKGSYFASDIIFTGYLEEGNLRTLLKNARALLYVSLYEGFGIPILQSYSLGTPVVCSNTASLPEVAGAKATYVNPLDLQSIKEGISDITKKRKSYWQEFMGLQLSNFSWRKSAELLKKTFLSV